MFLNRLLVAGALASLMLSQPGPALAQSDSNTEPEAQDQPSPELGYSSVFDNYVPFDHVPEMSWQDANKEAGAFGGWRAYLNLVQELLDEDDNSDTDKDDK